MGSLADIPIRLERGSEQSLPRQIAAQIRRAILDGRLPPGSRLPSTRALAQALGVSRNVALAAYDDLHAEGYIEGRHGSGTYVASDLPPLPRPAAPPLRHKARWLRDPVAIPEAVPADLPGGIAFRLGQPSLAPLSRETWRRIWSRVASDLPPAGYGPVEGDPQLRAAIAGHLNRTRGVPCGPDDVVVTAGAIQALMLLARAVLQPGDRAAIEDPGYPTARRVLMTTGAALVPVPVDHDGVRVECLPTGRDAPLLVYVTPSHQYPLGVRLSVARRLSLLEWAREHDSLIVEDDYDSEFRFDAPPLPPLAALDEHGQVAYVGTFSKVLTPSLRVGYLVASRALLDRVVRLKRLADYHTSWPVQQALAAFVSEGELDRHIQRARRLYAERRRALRDGLAPVIGWARLWGLEAGLHAFLELAPGLSADRVAALARARGVIVSTLDDFSIGEPERQGLLLGYGGLELDEIARGTQVLVDVITELGETHATK